MSYAYRPQREGIAWLEELVLEEEDEAPVLPAAFTCAHSTVISAAGCTRSAWPGCWAVMHALSDWQLASNCSGAYFELYASSWGACCVPASPQ